MKNYISIFCGLCVIGLSSLLFLSCNKTEDKLGDGKKTISEWYYIDEASLGEWSAGVCNDKCYMAEYIGYEGGNHYVYANLFDAANNAGVTFTIDADNKVSAMLYDEYTFRIYYEDEILYLTEVDENGDNVNTVACPLPKSISTSKSCMIRTKADDDGITCVMESLPDYLDIFQAGMTAQNVIDRGLFNAIRDEVSILSVLKKYKRLEKVLEKSDDIDDRIGEIREWEQERILGNASVSIGSIVKQGNGAFSVTVRASGLNTVPSIWYDYTLNSHSNRLYFGVVAGDKTVYRSVWPSYYTCQYQSSLQSLPLGGGSFTYSFHMSGITNNETIRFRPYIISDRELDGYIVHPKGEYLAYGEGQEYAQNTAFIENCKTISSKYNNGQDNVEFQCGIDVMQFCGNGEQWGIYMIDKNGQRKMFPAHNANAKSAVVEFSVPVDEMTLNYSDYSAIHSARFGVFILYKDGTFSYSDATSYNLSYSERPSIEFTSATILGTRSNKAKSSGKSMYNSQLYDSDNGDDEEEEEEEDEDADYVTEFEQTFVINGAMWISAINYTSTGTPRFSVQSASISQNGTYRTRGLILYDSKMISLSATSYYSLVLRNGSTVPAHYGCYINKLYWSGEEEITNVDWY